MTNFPCRWLLLELRNAVLSYPRGIKIEICPRTSLISIACVGKCFSLAKVEVVQSLSESSKVRVSVAHSRFTPFVTSSSPFITLESLSAILAKGVVEYTWLNSSQAEPVAIHCFTCCIRSPICSVATPFSTTCIVKMPNAHTPFELQCSNLKTDQVHLDLLSIH